MGNLESIYAERERDEACSRLESFLFSLQKLEKVSFATCQNAKALVQAHGPNRHSQFLQSRSITVLHRSFGASTLLEMTG